MKALDTVFHKAGNVMVIMTALTILMRKIVHQSLVQDPSSSVPILNSVFTNLTNVTESPIVMTVRTNWDVQALLRINARINNFSVEPQKSVSHKVRFAIDHPTPPSICIFCR